MASELGARDLVRLLPARGSLFLFGSSRKSDRIFGHSLLNAGQFTDIQKTERNRRRQCHWAERGMKSNLRISRLCDSGNLLTFGDAAGMGQVRLYDSQ